MGSGKNVPNTEFLMILRMLLLILFLMGMVVPSAYYYLLHCDLIKRHTKEMEEMCVSLNPSKLITSRFQFIVTMVIQLNQRLGTSP